MCIYHKRILNIVLRHRLPSNLFNFKLLFPLHFQSSLPLVLVIFAHAQTELDLPRAQSYIWLPTIRILCFISVGTQGRITRYFFTMCVYARAHAHTHTHTHTLIHTSATSNRSKIAQYIKPGSTYLLPLISIAAIQMSKMANLAN